MHQALQAMVESRPTESAHVAAVLNHFMFTLQPCKRELVSLASAVAAERALARARFHALAHHTRVLMFMRTRHFREAVHVFEKACAKHAACAHRLASIHVYNEHEHFINAWPGWRKYEALALARFVQTGCPLSGLARDILENGERVRIVVLKIELAADPSCATGDLWAAICNIHDDIDPL